MKTLSIFLIIVNSLFSFSQDQLGFLFSEYKGPVKSVVTYTYSTNKSDTLANLDSLYITCKVCDHYEKFDRNGQLAEKQEYVIMEPVSDLSMGYCSNLVFDYKRNNLVSITSKKFEKHGMDLWDDGLADGTEEIIYSTVKNGDVTTTEYVDVWGSVISRQYKNGLLVKDDDRIYYYNDVGQKIKSISIEGDSITNSAIETWTYRDELLLMYTKIRPESVIYGFQTQYTYHDSGKLFLKEEYKLSHPKNGVKKELESAQYYCEDGRDSISYYVSIYSKEKKKRTFNYNYQFHSNGSVSTKTYKTASGEVCGFESYDERGNLTQINAYNINLEAYRIEKFIYNERNELIEKHVVDNYHDEEYRINYRYDKYGNQTHQYRKTDESIKLVVHRIFEYYK